MASVSRDRNGNVCVQFVGPDRKRRTVRLGKVSQKTADGVKLRVEHLASSLVSNLPLDPDTARWVAAVGDDLAARLAAVGLIPPRVSRTVDEFLTGWLGGKKAAGFKPTSLIAWGQTVTEFSAMFVGRSLASLAHADGEKFRDRMRDRGLRATTVHKRLSHAKGMLEDAVRLGYIPANPFRHVRTRQGDPSERRAYVRVDDIRRVIDHMPGVWWKLLVALARYGGLRVPSEPFALTWGDVDWERERLTVPSPKTEGQGKPHRTIPLFPLLKPHLEAAFDAAAEGDVYVFPDEFRRRAAGERGWNGANVRTTLEKIIRRAKVNPWSRLWHSLRSSCESDLARSFPLAVVAKWLGNTPSVVLRHYVDPSDASFVDAANWTPPGAAPALQNAVQLGADQSGRETTGPSGTPEFSGNCPLGSVTVRSGSDQKMEAAGIRRSICVLAQVACR